MEKKKEKQNVLNFPVNQSSHFFPQLSDQFTPAHRRADSLIVGWQRGCWMKAEDGIYPSYSGGALLLS